MILVSAPQIGRQLSRPTRWKPLFKSFFAGGFECSLIRGRSGRVQDLIRQTEHDRYAHLDYLRLVRQGVGVAREGLRWHLVEQQPGKYDFSSALPIVRAARSTGTEVIWDLCHFGWPQYLDIFSVDFINRLAAYGAAFAQWLSHVVNGPLLFVPINEISFFSWAAAEEGSLFPFQTGRGFELKKQLVRAAIKTMDAIWSVRPSSKFVHVDPIINVVAHPRHQEDKESAEAYRMSQYQAFDMLSGRLCPELGGGPKYLDVIGVNYYPQNQWFYDLKGFRRVRKFRPLSRRHPLYRPFSEMLKEAYGRFQQTVVIEGTGEGRCMGAVWC